MNEEKTEYEEIEEENEDDNEYEWGDYNVQNL
jgi:hypothetical protein